MKSLREVQGRHPGFDDRKPGLPPFPPVLPGEDPPAPTYDWVLPLILVLMIFVGIATALVFLRAVLLG